MEFAIVVGFFVFGLGVYVYRNSLQNASSQKWFLLFNISVGSWIFMLGLRSLIVSEWREVIHHFLLIPILFSPYLFFRFVKSIFDRDYKMGRVATGLNVIVIGYFLFIAINLLYSAYVNTDNFSHRPTIHYHLLIMYCTVYFAFSLFVLWREVGKHQLHRIQAMLITVGTLIGLSISVLFVYILPLLCGIYLAPCSAIGVAIANLFFAAAVLLGNVFKLNANLLSGKPLPWLSRVVVIAVVVVYRYVDPAEFLKKSQMFSERVEATNEKLWEMLWSIYEDDGDVKKRIRDTAKEISVMNLNL
ncbi:LIC10906 family membrane protein [Leptospira alexanderi]|uniref:LIC10906 family membrane protein n=1 Tax=Leptospira alexanderi TaxID=100053 RepID=UPI0009912DA2|nr:hypothetical protein [Leptospira alexanderi]